MAPFSFNSGQTAIVTGGASGIGLAVVTRCVQAGMNVLVADRNEKLLQKINTSFGSQVSTFKMDVAQLDDWTRPRERFDTDHKGELDFLFLNAGIQPASHWGDTAAFNKIMDVNFYGVVHGLTTFLSTIKDRPDTAIVITGSKQGITNPPGNPAYNASKAAVKTLAEHLSYDLRDAAATVHLLVPGWTFTGLGRSDAVVAQGKPDAAWTAEQVVDYMEDKMAQGQFYILCPDNEVTEAMDSKRILWAAGDMMERRPPLSRWREEFRAAFQQWCFK